MSYVFLLWLAIILVLTKVLGLITRRIGLPEVVGYLVAGIILGPSVLNLMTVSETNVTSAFLEDMAELGVIFLMFSAGLETDLKEMKKNLVASLVVAGIGVIVPLILGAVAFGLYFGSNFGNHEELLKCVFVGVVLTATSVSITVQTLRELGRLSNAVGTTILGAAVIDDILGIIVLTVVTSLKDTSVSPGAVLLKIMLYAVFILALIFVASKAEPLLAREDGKRRIVIAALAWSMLLAFASEYFFDIADITGAYFAGIMLCNSKSQKYINDKLEGISPILFSPIFFASIGIKVALGGMSARVWIFAVILTLVAILSKIIGCGLGAKLCGFKAREALQVGVGMVSRGEVALIVAEKGRQVGLIESDMFAPVVLVVIVTTLLTPILLKIVFSKRRLKPEFMTAGISKSAGTAK